MGRRPGTPKTGGRKRGTPNKTTALLKDAILQAAEQAGGEGGLTAYLKMQAHANPGPFMSLLGKVLPTQIGNDPENPITKDNDEHFARVAGALEGIAAATKGGAGGEG